MDDVFEWKGLNGQLKAFRKEVGDARKITFIGSPGVCTPFAEFAAYSVRDKETYFIPLLNIDECHHFEFKGYAMVLNDETADPHGSDVVVLLDGLAMSRYDVDTDDLNRLIDEILNENGKIMGFGFMDMFTKAGWLDKVDFDCIIDGTLTGVVKR